MKYGLLPLNCQKFVIVDAKQAIGQTQGELSCCHWQYNVIISDDVS